MQKRSLFIALILIQSVFSFAGKASLDVTFLHGNDIQITVNQPEAEVVKTAIDIFSSDFQRVFQSKIVTSDNGQILVGTIGLNSLAEKTANPADIIELKNKHEGFLLTVKNGIIIVLGSDKRGTAYGVLEISRIIGVSPWEWWADSPITPKQKFTLKNDFKILTSPSVKHRGIFINDEDFGLTPWSYKNFEPSNIKGQIGSKTHARIFELLLRLRANTFWPAMHECSIAFYMTPGNKEMADKYGIYVGSSHCEPMNRNTNFEWKKAGTGDYNYLTNKDNILKFWEERTKQLSGSDNIYTLGIRGVHDGKMQGANTVQEQKDALTQILKDQRDMIKNLVNPDVEKVSQVFIPYKEVLDVYNAGLEVPDDVTLMWCDDNYGYINHFPTAAEQSRKGGNGVYYHVSYWGRPHDYLWLSTTHPAQIYYQLKLAYDKGARDMWIINVGDIKPAEYELEMIMDMAWDINAIQNNKKSIDNHLKNWLQREFGQKNSSQLLHIMNEYYRLAFIHKPEFMGNTRTEETNPSFKIVSDMPWSENEILQRISDYEAIEQQTIKIAATIPEEKQAAWFQLIDYPVRAAAEMNRKHLYGQLARHKKADWQRSDAAYNEIVTLTKQYNQLLNGKWNYMMDFSPRDLAVFSKLKHDSATTSLKEYIKPLKLLNGTDFDSFTGNNPVNSGLGYERKAVSIDKNSALNYSFSGKSDKKLTVEFALIPNHPVEGKKIRIAASVDNGSEQIFDYHTEGRSEEWKMNVLYNRSVRKMDIQLNQTGKHILTVRALDEGVILDQIKITEK